MISRIAIKPKAGADNPNRGYQKPHLMIVLLYIQRKKKWSLSSTIFSMSCSVNEANLEVIFLLLHGRQTTQSAQTLHDYP